MRVVVASSPSMVRINIPGALPKHYYVESIHKSFSCGQILLIPTANDFMQYCFHAGAGCGSNRTVQPVAKWRAGQARLERIPAGQAVRFDARRDLTRPLGHTAKMGGLRQAGPRPGLPGRGGFSGSRFTAIRPGQRPSAGTNHYHVPTRRPSTAALHFGFRPVYHRKINFKLVSFPTGDFCV